MFVCPRHHGRPFHLRVLGLAAALILGAAPTAVAAGIGQGSPSSGRLDVLFRHDGNGSATDPNRDSLVQLTRYNGTWAAPVNTGGSLSADSDIGVASRGFGKLDIVVRWSDNTLRSRAWTAAGGWGAWVTVPGTVLTGGPSLAAQGGDGLTAAYRDRDGKVRVRTWSPAGGWSASAPLTTAVKAGTGPAIVSPQPGKLRLVTVRPTDGATEIRELQSGPPTVESNWSAPARLGTSTGWDATPSLAARGPLNPTAPGADTIDVFERQASTRTLFARAPFASFASLGTTVAASPATARPGASTLANAVGASWSNRLSGASAQLDVSLRRDDGCLYSRTKTSTASTATWTALARLPTTPLTNGRCSWPARAGGPVGTTPPPPVLTQNSRVPLVKRADPADNAGLQLAQDGWLGGSNTSALNWYKSRDQALILHDGPDWPTSWAPRNWHPNTWVYRKSTSYLGSDGLQNVSPTSGYFVRLNGSGHLAAVNYACGSSGCTQPLLNVTNAAARNYWLRGPDNVAPTTKPTNCTNFAAHDQDGVLDQLACGYEGVWLDDVLAELAGGGGAGGSSYVADDVTGAAISNGALASALPFTQAQWESGLATMIEELRAGVATLKSKGVLTSTAGTIAANYKWTTFGFAVSGRTGAAPTISPTSTAGRIIKALDLVELEQGWIDNGLTSGTVAQDYSFARMQRFVDQIHALGSHVLEEKTNSADIQEFGSDSCLLTRQTQSSSTNAGHYTTAQYNLAASLLGWVSGDWVGDICEVFGRGWDGYQTNLGAPLGARETLSNGLQRRQFEGGWVLVAPPGRSGTVALPQAMRMRPNGVDGQGLVSVTSVALTQRQGAVLLK